jgi:hypothetical protein
MRRTDPNLLSVDDAARACGIGTCVLRQWDKRYGWPCPERDANGYRWYPPALIRDIQRFLAAGRPFHQIHAGHWFQPVAPSAPKPPAVWPHAHPGIDRRLRLALQEGNHRLVAETIADLVRLHPAKRGPILAAIRDASLERGREYDGLLRHFGYAVAP